MNWFSEYCNRINAKLVMVQEHFKISNNALGLFRNEFINYNINCKKAVRKEDELRGRGSASLIQMSHKDMDMNTAPINMSSYRLQAQRLKVGPRTILLLNVYFPVDGDDTDELTTLLTELELIINCEGIRSVIVGGDFNYGASRTSVTAILTKECLDKMDLYSV